MATRLLSRRLSAGQTLRDATSAAHDEVDSIFSRFDLTHEAGYRAFLLAQARAHLPVEAALDAADASRVFGDWPERRRAVLLRDDLEELGATTATGPAPTTSSTAEIAGAVYVIEGSRLGGALLKRSVAAGLPTRFLSAPAAPGAWRALLLRLDALLDEESELERAADAARRVFALFAAAGRALLERVDG